MRNGQQQFPVEVRTSWVDYSPALRYHASQRIRSRLSEFASHIRSITVRISDDEPHHTAQRRCDIEVMTTDAGAIAASSVGVELFTLVERAIDTVVEILRQRTGGEPHRGLRHGVA
jgi:hypothetical protein